MPTAQLSSDDRETAALNAYLCLLESKGADRAALEQRKGLILRLTPLLAHQPVDSNFFRISVERVLSGLEKGAWPAFLIAVREYFHFWAGDIKAIATMSANGGYKAAPLVNVAPDQSLKSLWDNLGNEKFGITETWSLKAYTSALRDEGADRSVEDTRSKLVKLLLVRLRGVPEKDARSYRTAVDCCMALFNMKETRQLFLLVAREFFYFWIADPDARSHILLDLPQPAS
jgi:hypothetical protein